MKTQAKSLIIILLIMLIFKASAQITLNLRVFLEGLFNGSSQNTKMNVIDDNSNNSITCLQFKL
jgi:hypothetical protein